MRNAYEMEEEFSPDGRRIVRRKWVWDQSWLGPVVALVALLTGKALVSLPSLLAFVSWPNRFDRFILFDRPNGFEASPDLRADRASQMEARGKKSTL
jgi:hypothetical protein